MTSIMIRCISMYYVYHIWSVRLCSATPFCKSQNLVWILVKRSQHGRVMKRCHEPVSLGTRVLTLGKGVLKLQHHLASEKPILEYFRIFI